MRSIISPLYLFLAVSFIGATGKADQSRGNVDTTEFLKVSGEMKTAIDKHEAKGKTGTVDDALARLNTEKPIGPEPRSVKFECLPVIDTRQNVVTLAPYFTVYTDKSRLKNHLVGITLFEGHPREMASLKPDNGDEKGPWFWTLDPKSPYTYFMLCEYSSTVVTMIKGLPSGFTTCRTMHKDEDVIGLSCARSSKN